MEIQDATTISPIAFHFVGGLCHNVANAIGLKESLNSPGGAFAEHARGVLAGFPRLCSLSELK
jgi:hypothetical protein